MNRDMRAAVGEAASSGSSERLPRLLFGGRQADSVLARLDARLDELVTAVAGVVQEVQVQRQLLAAAAAPPAEPERPELLVELLFVPSPAGYRLVEQEAAAARGGAVRVDGLEHRVAVVRRSPLLDGRRCAYLDPA